MRAAFLRASLSVLVAICCAAPAASHGWAQSVENHAQLRPREPMAKDQPLRQVIALQFPHDVGRHWIQAAKLRLPRGVEQQRFSATEPGESHGIDQQQVQALEPGESHGINQQQVQALEPGESHDIDQQRALWLFHQRAYPQGFIPAGARAKALMQMRQMEALQQRLRAGTAIEAATTVTGASWTSIGPAPLDTHLTGSRLWSGMGWAFAIDPRSSSVAYLGTAGGGIWKTTDAGTTWLPLTDDLGSLSISYITLDPNNPDTIYAGTGGTTLSLYGEGILKSTNGGASWTQLPGPASGTFQSSSFFATAHGMEIAVQPGNSQVLLAATWKWPDAGIYRSTDAGLSWSLVLGGGRGYQVLFDPSNPSTAYATVTDPYGSTVDGAYKSTNGGATWQAAMGTGTNVLPKNSSLRYEIAMAASNPQILYAVLADLSAGSGLSGVWKTTDGAQNWTKLAVSLDLCDLKCGFDDVTRIDPSNPNRLITGGEWPYLSSDGGNTWTKIATDGAKSGSIKGDVRSVAFSTTDHRVYLGDDGGAWLANDITSTGFTWTSVNAALVTILFYPGMSIHPTNVNVAYAGSQDNGLDLYSGAARWTWLYNCDGGWSVIDYNNPSTVYGTCQPPAQILKSTSSGGFGTWSTSQTGISTSEYTQFIPPIAMDTADPKTLYFGTTRMYQSRDGAASWTAISPDLAQGATFSGHAISSMAVAPTDNNTVYAVTGTSRVWVTNNATSGTGSTWTQISSGLPPRYPTMVVVDPASASTAYVTYSGFSGFSGDTKGHVFKTTNRGSAWIDISGNLPNIPVNDLAVDPDLPNTLYIGTDIGVFATTDGGSTWAPIGSGLPHAIVHSLKLHRPSRILRAATFGRSAWDLAIPLNAAVTPQSGWWWDSNLSGMGFFVEYGGKSGTGMFVGGYVYDASGNATWLVSTGAMSGSTYTSNWLRVTGGQTLLGAYKAPTSTTSAGSLSINFTDSTHAVMTRPDGTQISLQRFSFSGATPTPPVAGAPQSGWWWGGASLSGTGYGIEIQGNSVFIVAYMYDNAGNPVWYLATGNLTTPTSYTGTWDVYAGGPQLTSPEGSYGTHKVSSASPMTLTFADTTHGTLTMGSVSVAIQRFQEF